MNFSDLFRRPKEVAQAPQERDQYQTVMDMLSGYFNQDWDYETDNLDEILAQARDENSPVAVERVIRELKQFVATYGQSDESLTAAFERIFTPEADFYDVDRMTSREGFQHAIEILSAPRKGSAPVSKP